MYRTTSRSAQGRRERGGAPEPKMGTKEFLAELDRRAAPDLTRLHDPKHLSRIGGWPLDRLDRAGAVFRTICTACKHAVPERFVNVDVLIRNFGGLAAGTPLIQARRMLRCERCASRRVRVEIKTRRGVVVF